MTEFDLNGPIRERPRISWTPAKGGFSKMGDQPPGSVSIEAFVPGDGKRKKFAMQTSAGFNGRTTIPNSKILPERVFDALQLFLDFHTMVVRDGIDPQVAHREFLKIKQYADHISPDIPRPEKRTWAGVERLLVSKSEGDRIFGLKQTTCDALIKVGMLKSEFVAIISGNSAMPIYRIGDILEILKRNGMTYRPEPPAEIKTWRPSASVKADE